MRRKIDDGAVLVLNNSRVRRKKRGGEEEEEEEEGEESQRRSSACYQAPPCQRELFGGVRCDECCGCEVQRRAGGDVSVQGEARQVQG